MLPTPATWMRAFVRSHPDYKEDSVITPSIARSLCLEVNDIACGRKECPELLGAFYIAPLEAVSGTT